jgi:hypothetical protein
MQLAWCAPSRLEQSPPVRRLPGQSSLDERAGRLTPAGSVVHVTRLTFGGARLSPALDLGRSPYSHIAGRWVTVSDARPLRASFRPSILFLHSPDIASLFSSNRPGLAVRSGVKRLGIRRNAPRAVLDVSFQLAPAPVLQRYCASRVLMRRATATVRAA